MTMHYNLTTEERYILTLSDTMLKEGYTVDEVIEFLQCEDMDQVECILGTLTLTESADVDHPDLELVVERLQSLGRIGSWLTRQAGKLKGLFGKGASKVKLKPTGTGGVKKVKSTNPRGPGKNLRGKKVTGDVTPTLGDKVKKGLKIAAGAGLATLALKGIDDTLNSDDEPSIRPETSGNNGDGDGSGNNGDKEDGRDKGYGSRTRAYGWWQKSHANAPYVDTDHFKNIRGKGK